MGRYCVYFEGKMRDNDHILIERSLIIMSKHLTLDERTTIQTSLGKGKTIGQIAKALGKATSTISREVRKHAITVRKGAYGYGLNECEYRYQCSEKGFQSLTALQKTVASVKNATVTARNSKEKYAAN